ITGGGFLDNIPRIVPGPCRAVIRRGTWPVSPVFDLIRKTGNIEEMEMLRVFNMGIGMILIAAEKDEAEILERLEMLGEKAYAIGMIEKRENDQLAVSFV
ncbi:MAG: phosphoribosylformylglycinamidine cyclo-ligase, partial [Proteobacteria bacterium]|nr:phosphoribosylformylglycinamidine cyclo-ligase [Pseudomonadota bacterium]